MIIPYSVVQKIDDWKITGKKIVFTNGCFDILHAGHIDYLREASQLGDVLVVGLNSDASIRRLKGDSRPINSENDRKKVLEAISFVDEVIIFNEDTPLNLINAIRPDVLVKGGDWPVDEIVGSTEVIAYGGSVRSLGFTEGISTSTIIEKILSKYR